MAGLHLQQLHTACLGLESTLNTALSAASLTQLTDVYADPPSGTPTCPYLVVTLAGWRRRETAAAGPSTQETVTVSFRIETDDGESDALAYEGVVAGVVADAQATLAAAVTDAALIRWQGWYGKSTRTNGTTWETVIKWHASLEW
ncbi:MAG: hypothetical protein HYU66_29605 [Armatimonadetes bacterium]|nr:hypothetical protein [Armatimonadota bacterium]